MGCLQGGTLCGPRFHPPGSAAAPSPLAAPTPCRLPPPPPPSPVGAAQTAAPCAFAVVPVGSQGRSLADALMWCRWEPEPMPAWLALPALPLHPLCGPVTCPHLCSPDRPGPLRRPPGHPGQAWGLGHMRTLPALSPAPPRPPDRWPLPHPAAPRSMTRPTGEDQSTQTLAPTKLLTWRISARHSRPAPTQRAIC